MDGSRLFITLMIWLILSVLQKSEPGVLHSQREIFFDGELIDDVEFLNRVLMPDCFAPRGLRGLYSSPLSRSYHWCACTRR